MNRLLIGTLTAVLALAPAAVFGGSCDKHCSCIEPPASCPDCSDPCCHRMNMAIFDSQKHIDALCSGCCCERVKAAKKLGCRLHADFCSCPEVLDALVKALLCDTCWEVRRAAAWAIAMQDARVPLGVLALAVSSRIDPHYMVRDGANDALGILIRCRRDCYDDLFQAADDLAKQLRGKYKPTSGDCIDLAGILARCGHEGGCSHCGGGAGVIMEGGPALPAAKPAGEPIPAPKATDGAAPDEPKPLPKSEVEE